MKPLILIVEDEPPLIEILKYNFEDAGFRTSLAADGDEGILKAQEEVPDLIILDWMLPKRSGIEVCRELKQDKHTKTVPIIMLTARDSIDDKISGFKKGADDYLTKPFSLEELEVRCFALARRHLLQTSDVLTFDTLIIDRKKQHVTRAGKTLELNSMGYRILTILAQEYPQVVSRSKLSQKLWGDEPTESDALRSHIYQLRNTIDKPFEYPMIKTIHGIGFVLDVKK